MIKQETFIQMLRDGSASGITLMLAAIAAILYQFFRGNPITITFGYAI